MEIRIVFFYQQYERKCVHCYCRDRGERDSVLPDVLHMIGNTPLIRLDKIACSEGLKCNLREIPLTHSRENATSLLLETVACRLFKVDAVILPEHNVHGKHLRAKCYLQN